MSPKRIQRSRAKGWRMPEGAIYVGRPTRWGNRYKVGDENPVTGARIVDREEAVGLFQMDAVLGGEADAAEVRAELAGHDLVCWCPLDEPCHADVLLGLASDHRITDRPAAELPTYEAAAVHAAHRWERMTDACKCGWVGPGSHLAHVGQQIRATVPS